MAPVLVVGSRNRKKREEIVEILGDLDLELRDLTNWPDAPEVVEDGATFVDNARKKAVELSRYLKQCDQPWRSTKTCKCRASS